MPVNSEAAGMPDRSEAAEKTERQEPAAQARLPVNGARDVLTSEAPENYAETPPAGEAVVLAAQEFAETPPAMKQLLREQPQAAAAAMENKTAFGQKLKKIWGAVRPALAGFAAGAAAKAGIKFFAMRALDYGSVGASALAGGAVGGGLEFYKAYKGETKRLYDLETYNRTLDGYERMTDMEKVKAYAVIENALKDKNLNPAQNAELSAKMATLKVLVEQRERWEDLEGADKIQMLLKLRNSADRQQLTAAQQGEAKKLLEGLYKEKGLKRKWGKIAQSTLKGIVIGAAGGALGAWAFDKIFSGHIPGHISAENAGSHAHAAASADALRGAASAQAGESVLTVPGAEDAQTLHGTIWATCEKFINSHPGAHASARDINEAMIRICRENGIEISGHHPGGLPGLPAGNWNLTHNSFYPGFMHEHFGKLVDYKLQDGMQLKGFDALKDIVEHAGGHAEGARHIIVSATDKAAGGLADAGAHLQNQDLNLRRIYELVAGAGVLAGGGYLAKKFWKQRETKRAADIEQRPRVGRRDNDAAAAAGGTGEKAKKEILRTAQAEKNLSAGGLLGAGLDIAQERPEELPQDDGDDDEPGQVKLVAKNLPTATEKNQKGDLPAKNRGADFKTDGGKIAQPEKPTQELKEHKDQTLDPDYGIEKWKVPYYKKAVDLKILGVDEPVHISRLTEKREIALTQFILLMNEGSDSAFHVLYQDREAEMQKGLKEALVSLKGGRAENLRIFCSRILEDGENFKNVSEAARILGCIRDLSPQAGGIVKQALREFNLKRRKEKK